METTELSSYFHGFANIVLQLSYNSATHSQITFRYMNFQWSICIQSAVKSSWPSQTM